MPDFDYQLLQSVGELRRAAPAWDELWQRSLCANPSARAEPLATWIEHFAPRAPLATVVVRSQGELVAALPLLGSGPGLLRVGTLPGNCWSSAAALLVDSTVDPEAALDCLIRGLKSLAWPLLRLDAVMPATAAWRDFGSALERARLASLMRPRCRVDQIDVSGDWSTYLASRSHNHRRQVRRLTARAGADVKLHVFDRLEGDELATWLRRGFMIEDAGWKGRAGSSVLKNPPVFDFYLRQARYFAATGQLRLIFLEHRDRWIAFEYGWQAKGTYSPLKVAYDETARQLSPGQLLRTLLVERFFGDPEMREVDFLGPSSRATHEFSTGDYPVARWLVAVHPLGGPLLKAYRLLSPLARKLRRESSAHEEPTKPGRDEADERPSAPVAEPASA
ncbi:MAG TPA: GNAT family N-acetyltransferase [Pirellulales bacterium]|nr:GNAT family N-acetyltransferase [Pirellulales bacterium]